MIMINEKQKILKGKDREQYEKNYDQIFRSKPTIKFCPQCMRDRDIATEWPLNKARSDGLASMCRRCKYDYDKAWSQNNKKVMAAHRKRWINKNPWVKHYVDAGTRCNNPHYKYYHLYGERGIKRMITSEEVKKLWFRDEAYDLIKPSLDRINSDDHYRFGNCRFIEFAENSRRGLESARKKKAEQKERDR